MSECNLRIAVLISGGGSTLKNLLDRQAAGEVPIDCKLVISSKATAAGLEFAREAAVPTHVISRRDYATGEAHQSKIFELCRQAEVELVVMGGYLDHLLIPDDFENKVINVHPSLIPAFSGKGFYGIKVHRAVLDYGAKLSGCTVHFVDNEFDHGPIIAQSACAVESGDTPQSLQARIAGLERELYPKTITAIARGQIAIAGRRVSLNC